MKLIGSRKLLGALTDKAVVAAVGLGMTAMGADWEKIAVTLTALGGAVQNAIAASL